MEWWGWVVIALFISLIILSLGSYGRHLKHGKKVTFADVWVGNKRIGTIPNSRISSK